MTETFATIVLYASQGEVIIPLLCGLFLWGHRAIFLHGVAIVMTSMLWNSWLKWQFHIPLLPSVSPTGFAFPSGHMQLSVVLYGWIALAYPSRWMMVGVTVVWAAVGWGLVEKGYHQWMDIFGALVSGPLLLFVYRRGLSWCPRLFGWWMLALNSVLFLWLGLVGPVKSYLWGAYGVFLGAVVSPCGLGRPLPIPHEAVWRFGWPGLQRVGMMVMLALAAAGLEMLGHGPYALGWRMVGGIALGFLLPYAKSHC